MYHNSWEENDIFKQRKFTTKRLFSKGALKGCSPRIKNKQNKWKKRITGKD